MKKYCVIIDTYPGSSQQQELLLRNLKVIKEQGIEVLLTSHHPCSSEIIENTTYFLFEKRNDYHFLDSEILNENIRGVESPVFMKYETIGDEVFYNKLVITGWSVAITSQLFNSIKFLYGKGYDYAFYMVDDCIVPENFAEKISCILEKSKNKNNYFIRNKPLFGSWFAGFFFGFSITDQLISRFPNLDFSSNKTYQKYFPNCAGEDVILRIWGNDDNYIEDHGELNNIFGQNKWNLVSSVIKPGPSQLHNQTSSSIYVNLDHSINKYCLMLHTAWDCLFESVLYNIKISNQSGDLLYERSIELPRGHWFKDYLDHIFENENEQTFVFYKQIISSDRTLELEDTIIIEKRDLHKYSELKRFEKA